MTADLYALLGVAKTASKNEIRTAYRALARKLHPDHGGNAQEFIDVTRAYDVLVNEEFRARYDETGAVAENDLKKQRDKVEGILSHALDQVIDGASHNIKENDIIRMMRQVIDSGRTNFGNQIKELDRVNRSLEEIKRRITRKDESKNTFSDVLEKKIRINNSFLASLREELSYGDMARAALDGHESIVDAVREFQSAYYPGQTGRISNFFASFNVGS